MIPAVKAVLYDWGGFNVWLFHRINDIHGPLLDQCMLLGTALGDHALFPIYIALLGTVAINGARSDPRRLAMPWLLAMAVFALAYNLDGWLLSWVKPYLDFPRPPLALPLGSVHIVGIAEFHHSLPSGHASFAMLCAASAWPALGRLGRSVAALFVLWVGVSRISLGAHFPADILVGYVSSLFIVLVVRTFFKLMAGPRSHAQELKKA